MPNLEEKSVYTGAGSDRSHGEAVNKSRRSFTRARIGTGAYFTEVVPERFLSFLFLFFFFLFFLTQTFRDT